MLRLLGEDLFQDGRGFELVGVRLVHRARGRVEGERVEDRGFAVVRVARGELLHPLAIGERARPVLDLVGIAIERLDADKVEHRTFYRDTDNVEQRTRSLDLVGTTRERLAPADAVA